MFAAVEILSLLLSELIDGCIKGKESSKKKQEQRKNKNHSKTAQLKRCKQNKKQKTNEGY